MTRQPLAGFGLDPTADEVIATTADVWAELQAEQEGATSGR